MAPPSCGEAPSSQMRLRHPGECRRKPVYEASVLSAVFHRQGLILFFLARGLGNSLEPAEEPIPPFSTCESWPRAGGTRLSARGNASTTLQGRISPCGASSRLVGRRAGLEGRHLGLRRASSTRAMPPQAGGTVSQLVEHPLNSRRGRHRLRLGVSIHLSMERNGTQDPPHCGVLAKDASRTLEMS